MKGMKVVPDIHDFRSGVIHFMGIGGCSMSGLALLLKDRGYSVTGTNSYESEYLSVLREQGIRVAVGNQVENLAGTDLVVYTQAIREDDEYLLFLQDRGISIIPRSTLLGQLSEDFNRSIAVCGTHGKTTVTSMLAQILIETGADPTVHIGGVLPSIGGNVRSGRGEIFLTEACEYKRAFLALHVTDVILLNIDVDHLDYYRDIDEIESAFGEFLAKLPGNGWVLGKGDDERVVRRLCSLNCQTNTFGVSETCDYRMKNLTEDTHGYYQYDFCLKNETVGHVCMSVPGLFNAENAAAALAMSHHLGIDLHAAIEVIGRFTGAHRRFELTGTLNGAELFTDYGHNPTEMRNAVSIARKRCRRGKLWAVIQPHTFSRVKTLFQDYLTCTEEADVTLVTDICGAREDDPGDISSGMLVAEMKAHGVNAILTPTFEDAAQLLRTNIKEGDLVITLGCGDVYVLNKMLQCHA